MSSRGIGVLFCVQPFSPTRGGGSGVRRKTHRSLAFPSVYSCEAAIEKCHGSRGTGTHSESRGSGCRPRVHPLLPQVTAPTPSLTLSLECSLRCWRSTRKPQPRRCALHRSRSDSAKFRADEENRSRLGKVRGFRTKPRNSLSTGRSCRASWTSPTTWHGASTICISILQ